MSSISDRIGVLNFYKNICRSDRNEQGALAYEREIDNIKLQGARFKDWMGSPYDVCVCGRVSLDCDTNCNLFKVRFHKRDFPGESVIARYSRISSVKLQFDKPYSIIYKNKLSWITFIKDEYNTDGLMQLLRESAIKSAGLECFLLHRDSFHNAMERSVEYINKQRELGINPNSIKTIVNLGGNT